MFVMSLCSHLGISWGQTPVFLGETLFAVINRDLGHEVLWVCLSIFRGMFVLAPTIFPTPQRQEEVYHTANGGSMAIEKYSGDRGGVKIVGRMGRNAARTPRLLDGDRPIEKLVKSVTV